MSIITPKMCEKCITFPCICGQQYKHLDNTQLSTLIRNLNSFKNADVRNCTIKELISIDTMQRLPKKFTTYLFEKNKDKKVQEVWDNLKDSNMLWKSCLAVFLARYGTFISTRNYYNFMLEFLGTFNIEVNALLSQVFLVADNGGLDINIPLLRSSVADIITKISEDGYSNKHINTYIQNCVFLATCTIQTQSLNIYEALFNIILHVAGITDTINVCECIDNTSIDIEDQVIYIDESICNIVYNNFSGEFKNLEIG